MHTINENNVLLFSHSSSATSSHFMGSNSKPATTVKTNEKRKINFNDETMGSAKTAQHKSPRKYEKNRSAVFFPLIRKWIVNNSKFSLISSINLRTHYYRFCLSLCVSFACWLFFTLFMIIFLQFCFCFVCFGCNSPSSKWSIVFDNLFVSEFVQFNCLLLRKLKMKKKKKKEKETYDCNKFFLTSILNFRILMVANRYQKKRNHRQFT